MTITFDLPTFTSPADYITTAKRNRLVRLAVSSILMAKDGYRRSLAEISRQVGCSTRTVASVKIELDELELLGCIVALAPITRRAPDASFANLRFRITDLLRWLEELQEEGLSDARIGEAKVEAHEVFRIIKRKGSLPRHFHHISVRLEELEKLQELPELSWL